DQAVKLQDRSKYKSMFDDRVGVDYEEVHDVLRISFLEEEEDEESAEEGEKTAQKAAKEQGGEELTGRFTGSGPGRTLWRNMQEVEASGLLSKLSKEEVKLQEAQFEVITTEATYYKSLMVVIDVFYNSPLFDHTRPNAIVRALDKHYLFSNIVDIFDCSATFLKSLEDEWKKTVIMDSVSQVILDHIEKLKVYKVYCRNFYYQTKTLEKLRTNPEFAAECRMIPLQSYLEMPMKRAMSLQLLMDAVMRRMPENSHRYSLGMRALGQLLSLARECDQESRMMSEKEQMLKLQNQLCFSKVKKVGCWGGNRHLIKEGQMRVINAVPNTQGFVSKMSLRKTYLQLHAFSDLLIVSKPKGDQGFQVTLLLEPKSREEADRWLMIFSPRDELGDPVYDPDDCPQAKVVKAYRAQQKDDLELREGEIVSIYKKTEEGWLLGSRLADPNVRGWFLASHVREIENDHYRAKLRKVSFRRKNAIAMYARNKFESKV
uniref:SH3 domain-containing protein n=1 Tax=Macrostomum lignano TaxID=282301 RepID=A0A1I8IWV9_9PLAT